MEIKTLEQWVIRELEQKEENIRCLENHTKHLNEQLGKAQKILDVLNHIISYHETSSSRGYFNFITIWDDDYGYDMLCARYKDLIEEEKDRIKAEKEKEEDEEEQS